MADGFQDFFDLEIEHTGILEAIEYMISDRALMYPIFYLLQDGCSCTWTPNGM